MNNPEQIAVEIVRHYSEHGGIHPNVEDGLRDSIAAAVQSKQDETDRLKDLAEWAHTCIHHTDAERSKLKQRCPVCLQDEIDKLRELEQEQSVRREQAEKERNQLRCDVDKLHTRAEQAEAQSETWQVQATQFELNAADFLARATIAERERDEALEGLRPFALIAEWDSKRNAVQNYPDERLLQGFPESMDRAGVNIGHCRRAKEIIAKHEKT